MSHSNDAMKDNAGCVSWQFAGRLDEHRQHPRLALEIPVTFRNALGEHCAAMLSNVSPEGLQVRCDPATARLIHPAGARLEPGRQPILQARLTVPVAGVDEDLSLGVRLVHIGMLPDEPRCALGFSFLALRPRARRIVIGFFGERLRAGQGDSFGHVA
jgi:hypothetical protein